MPHVLLQLTQITTVCLVHDYHLAGPNDNSFLELKPRCLTSLSSMKNLLPVRSQSIM